LLENQAKAHGKVASAIKHALNAFDGLKRYCFDGRLEIDSNVVERCIRPVALTKKNSLFAGSHDAAKVWAIYNTILGTALLSKIDPREYLKWVVTQIEEQRGDVDYNALVPWLCPLHPFEDK
jgi:transposase